MSKKLKLTALTRSLPVEFTLVERAVEEGEEQKRPRYRMSVSSETPVPRWFGLEVLKHSRSAIDLTRAKKGLAVRDTHYGDQVGIAEEWQVGDDRRLYCEIEFSENARPQEIERDVKAGIRRGVSLRYVPEKMKPTKRGQNGEPDEYEVTRWMPIHVAFEPDPADVNVGVGRNSAEEEFSVEIEGDEPEGVRSMPCTKCNLTHEGACATTAAPATTTATADRSATPASPAPRLEVVGGSAVDRNKEIASIVRLCASHGVSERAAEFIELGYTEDRVSSEILKLKHTSGQAAPASEAVGRLPDLGKDAGRYSFRRAILAATGEGKLEGIEKEMHDEIRANMPAKYVDRGGVLVPQEFHPLSPQAILDRAYEMMFGARERSLDSKTVGGASELVFDQYGGLIPLLRNNAVVMDMGAQVLTGLTAPIVFTKQTGAADVQWVGENPGSDVPETQPSTGLVTLSPQTMIGASSFSRQLLVLNTESAERMVRNDLVKGHALKVDRAAYHGLGSAGEPQGIYRAPDVLAKAIGGAADWAEIVDMTAQVADQNALDGTLGWVAQTLLAGRYMTIPKDASAANSGWLWEGGNIKEGLMAGFRARSTSQLSKVMSGSDAVGGSSYGLIFGNWADLIIGLWGAMEIIPDPYAKKKQGMIEIASFQMASQVIRHGQSFCKGTGATLA